MTVTDLFLFPMHSSVVSSPAQRSKFRSTYLVHIQFISVHFSKFISVGYYFLSSIIIFKVHFSSYIQSSVQFSSVQLSVGFLELSLVVFVSLFTI